MPYYKWTAIDLDGSLSTGKEFARSQVMLATDLLTKELGLVKARQVHQFTLTRFNTLQYLEHLSLLLKAQVRLNLALEIVSKTVSSSYHKLIWQDLAKCINEGLSLSESMEFHHEIFDRLVISLVCVGEQTGNLAFVLEKLTLHLAALQEFKGKIQSALVTPLITFVFFLGILLIIFLVVVPQFNAIFQTFQEPLPWLTQLIVNISAFVSSWYFLLFMILGLLMILASIQLMRRDVVQAFLQKIIFSLPGIQQVVKNAYRAQFLSMLALLLKGDVTLVVSLDVINNGFRSKLINDQIQRVKTDVASGIALSDALRTTIFSHDELISLVLVGESSGNLAHVVDQAAGLYRQKVYNQLTQFSQLLHPALLILLGLFIAGLVVALYMPILTLTHMIKM